MIERLMKYFIDKESVTKDGRYITGALQWLSEENDLRILPVDTDIVLNGVS